MPKIKINCEADVEELERAIEEYRKPKGFEFSVGYGGDITHSGRPFAFTRCFEPSYLSIKSDHGQTCMPTVETDEPGLIGNWIVRFKAATAELERLTGVKE